MKQNQFNKQINRWQSRQFQVDSSWMQPEKQIASVPADFAIIQSAWIHMRTFYFAFQKARVRHVGSRFFIIL